MMGGMMGSSSIWGMCVTMGVFALIFIIVLGLQCIGYKVEDRPLMILKERYARGEIKGEEYNEKTKRLNEK
jgi:putative membrane protein